MSPDEQDAGPVRISKLLAARGVCSRREADAFIERGLVLVDGVRVSQLGARVLPSQAITLDPRAQAELRRQITILLNKPVGVVSGQAEKGYRDAASLIGPENRFAHDACGIAFRRDHLRGLATAGRLDIDSQGLLVLTQDGTLARRLIGAHSGIEKEYLVRVRGDLTESGLKLLNHGLELDGRPLRPARVTRLNEDQLCFILREGRKRQIRRMCALVGLDVAGLKRVRIGGVRLGTLPYGQWRYLAPGESF